MGVFVAGRYRPINIWLVEELNVQKVERNVVGKSFGAINAKSMTCNDRCRQRRARCLHNPVWRQSLGLV